ncbi:hypothetical protein ACJJTC_012819 [Scirpophaga incertulas]
MQSMELYGPARTAFVKSRARGRPALHSYSVRTRLNMSAPASPMESSSRKDTKIDVEHLIIAVQERPPLWNKHSKEYSDRNLKTRLWQEICENIVPKWVELSNQNKKKQGADIQRKWKNLKDCFSRELAAQKKSESGQSGRKKRKYIYFDELSFLIPITTPRETSGNISSIEECANSETQSDDDISQEKQNSRQAIYRRKTGTQARKENTDEEELLNILRKKQIHDEDVSFAEMLIPMLRKLNDDQKLYAKIEILNAMDRAKKYVPLPVYAASMQTVSQNVCPGSSTNMQTVPVYPRSILNVPQFVRPTNKIQTYTNTSDHKYVNSEPGTSSSSFVNPRNIVISKKKLSTKEPLIDENFNVFNTTSNDYYEQFGQDLQASDTEISQNSDDYYDVTMSTFKSP